MSTNCSWALPLLKQKEWIQGVLCGKIGVCCYSTEVERNAKYHVNITFYRYWLSGNYEQRLGRFSFKIGACCYTPLKTAQ